MPKTKKGEGRKISSHEGLRVRFSLQAQMKAPYLWCFYVSVDKNINMFYNRVILK